MRRRIIVAGALAQSPLGAAGCTWAFLQYVLGFRELGCETYYVEEIDSQHCIDDDWQAAPFASSANARYFTAVATRFRLDGAMALLQRDGGGHVGLSRHEVELLARDADLLLNLSGRFHDHTILAAVRRRMYLDLDPGFTQIWQERYHIDMNLAGHDVHVTVGLNVGAPDYPLPTCGINWRTTLPPVVLSEWDRNTPPGAAYTTVADWRGYSPVEWDGVWYGQKSTEFERVIDLPQHVETPLELCLAIHSDEPDRARLLAHGWHLSEPRQRIPTPDAYRDYILGSRGELTVAKQGYVAGRTGWVSDRSVCYLAAGRPVIVQDTGLLDHLPTGQGLLLFADQAEAAAALASVEADYPRHAEAARILAREHFNALRVLPRLLEYAGY
jgi:hypothetical protein